MENQRKNVWRETATATRKWIGWGYSDSPLAADSFLSVAAAVFFEVDLERLELCNAATQRKVLTVQKLHGRRFVYTLAVTFIPAPKSGFKIGCKFPHFRAEVKEGLSGSFLFLPPPSSVPFPFPIFSLLHFPMLFPLFLRVLSSSDRCPVKNREKFSTSLTKFRSTYFSLLAMFVQRNRPRLSIEFF